MVYNWDKRFLGGLALKSVLAVHDVSCLGRCSLTVALPVVSSFGVSCAVLPTALLSTHTGGFSDFTYLDLTEEMSKIIDSWQRMGLGFDVVYSGFLGSANQVNVIKRLASEFSATVVIDPVMGDDGLLYKVFDDDFVREMRQLVPFAHVLVPNMTEAMLLADVPFKVGPYSRGFIADLLGRLRSLGAKNVVLTGVYFDDDELGVAVCGEGLPCGGSGSGVGSGLGSGVGSGVGDCGLGGAEFSFFAKRRIEGAFHGTGDVFGSVLSACVARGDDLLTAAANAVEFVVDCIRATPVEQDRRFGVDFETVLARRGF